MRIIDMHCDTLLECYLKNERLRKNSLYVDLESMRKNQAMVQFFAAFIPSGEAASEDGLRKTPFTLFQEMAELYENEMNSNSDIIAPALSYSDIVENNRNNKMSSVLTVEDGQLLENKPERLELLYDKGVRLITLTWDYENCLGFPHSSYPDDNGKGLKPFGIEVVERMNRLGMIVDVSHLSEGGFYDVAGIVISLLLHLILVLKPYVTIQGI